MKKNRLLAFIVIFLVVVLGIVFVLMCMTTERSVSSEQNFAISAAETVEEVKNVSAEQGVAALENAGSDMIAIRHLDDATPEGWYDDYEAALQSAKASNKPLLLMFTGSDWCPWCVKLHDDVFSKKEFKDFSEKNIVLVYLDVPQSKKLPEKVTRQNSGLVSKYRISGYPCSVVVSSDGEKELGRVSGYTEEFVSLVSGFIGPKVSLAELKKIYSYLPDELETVGTEKVTRDDFLKILEDENVPNAKALSSDEIQPILTAIARNTALMQLAKQAGITPDKTMLLNILQNQYDRLLPSQKNKIAKTLKEKKTTLEKMYEEELNEMLPEVGQYVQIAYGLNLVNAEVKKEAEKISKEDAEKYYRENQSSFMVDGNVIPLDAALTEQIRTRIAYEKVLPNMQKLVEDNIKTIPVKYTEIKYPAKQ